MTDNPRARELLAVEGAIEDALSGWHYIRQHYGDLYGVGWDRVESRLTDAIVSARALASPQDVGERAAFQQRVQPWMMECFGPEIAADRIERNHRFLEEALELVQACGCTHNEAHQLVDYVYNRDQGDINQEVGGVMVTLAALCLANGFDMHGAGETELARISEPATIEKIRAKQAAKPPFSPLPSPPAAQPVDEDADEGWAADAARNVASYTEGQARISIYRRAKQHLVSAYIRGLEDAAKVVGRANGLAFCCGHHRDGENSRDLIVKNIRNLIQSSQGGAGK